MKWKENAGTPDGIPGLREAAADAYRRFFRPQCIFSRELGTFAGLDPGWVDRNESG